MATETANIFVVEQACKFSDDMSSGTVVVESRNDSQFNLAIEELQHANARNLATGYASQRGMGDARINGNLVGPYPVNREGKPLDQVVGPDGASLPPQHPEMQPKAYRVDVPVVRKLV